MPFVARAPTPFRMPPSPGASAYGFPGEAPHIQTFIGSLYKLPSMPIEIPESVMSDKNKEIVKLAAKNQQEQASIQESFQEHSMVS